jgi:hypothetical protein
MNWRTIIAASAALLMVALSKNAMAAGGDKFTLKSIEGLWGFSGDGVLAGPTLDDRLPIAGMGIISFDGLGGCQISGTTHVNGTALEADSDFCSYVVNPDGTGLIESSFPASGPLPAAEIPVAFVIVDQGSELRLIQTAVVVSHFVAKRVEGERKRHRRR